MRYTRRPPPAPGHTGARPIADASPKARTPPEPLPTLRTALPASEALARLDRRARAGKLPGYMTLGARTFRVDAFGQPFDGELIAAISDPGDDGRSAITFRLRTLRRMPVIFAVVIVFTVWPGVLLTDALIPGEWGWWPTWWWYLPLTILPLPFAVPKLWNRSQAALRTHAIEQIGRIEKAIDAKRE